jgi:hypothetical protein
MSTSNHGPAGFQDPGPKDESMNARNEDPGRPLATVPRDWDRVGILEWRQPRLLERRWDLVVDGETIAVLRSRGAFKRGFVAETSTGLWEIHTGWRGDATIRAQGSEAPSARFRRGWLGRGQIETGAGDSMSWRRRGWWRGQAVLCNREGFEFFCIRHRFSPPRIQASIELTDSGRRLDDLEPLLLLAWALMLESGRQGAHAH